MSNKVVLSRKERMKAQKTEIASTSSGEDAESTLASGCDERGKEPTESAEQPSIMINSHPTERFCEECVKQSVDGDYDELWREWEKLKRHIKGYECFFIIIKNDLMDKCSSFFSIGSGKITLNNLNGWGKEGFLGDYKDYVDWLSGPYVEHDYRRYIEDKEILSIVGDPQLIAPYKEWLTLNIGTFEQFLEWKKTDYNLDTYEGWCSANIGRIEDYHYWKGNLDSIDYRELYGGYLSHDCGSFKQYVDWKKVEEGEFEDYCTWDDKYSDIMSFHHYLKYYKNGLTIELIKMCSERGLDIEDKYSEWEEIGVGSFNDYMTFIDMLVRGDYKEVYDGWIKSNKKKSFRDYLRDMKDKDVPPSGPGAYNPFY